MKKILLGSVTLLALALGFFLGTLYSSQSCQANSPEKLALTQNQPQQAEKNLKNTPEKKMKRDKFKRKKWYSIEKLDSLLQLSPEQKTAMDSLRKNQDSLFSIIRTETKKAEMNLREAMEAQNPDSALIESAKKKILEVQEFALNHRILGNSRLSKILTPEQKQKMQEFHKAHFKKRKLK